MATMPSASESLQSGKPTPYSSDLITILVGPDKSAFIAHQDILCARSSFFKACMSSGFSESSSKTVSLPEDDPTIFGMIIDWVYKNSVRKPAGYVGTFPHTQVYLLAEKLGMQALCNQIIEALVKYSRGHIVDAKGLKDLPPCQIREYLVNELAVDLEWLSWQELCTAKRMRSAICVNS